MPVALRPQPSGDPLVSSSLMKFSTTAPAKPMCTTRVLLQLWSSYCRYVSDIVTQALGHALPVQLALQAIPERGGVAWRAAQHSMGAHVTHAYVGI